MNRKSLWTVFGVFLSALTVTPNVSGHDTTARIAYLTFSHPMRLPGVALGSGTYIFEVANPTSGSDVVRVMSRDRRRSYFMGFTTRVDRPPQLRKDAVVSIGESPRNTAPPIMAWWPLGESAGRAFVYR